MCVDIGARFQAQTVHVATATVAFTKINSTHCSTGRFSMMNFYHQHRIPPAFYSLSVKEDRKHSVMIPGDYCNHKIRLH